jgi:hypothetical protein
VGGYNPKTQVTCFEEVKEAQPHSTLIECTAAFKYRRGKPLPEDGVLLGCSIMAVGNRTE